MSRLYPCLRACAAALLLLGSAQAAHAATIVVTTNADDNTVNGNCTLREAFQAANTNAAVDQCAAGSPGGDTVLLTAIAGQTVTLTLGQIDVTDGVTVGDFASAVTVAGAGASRLFAVDVAGTAEPVQFANLTFANGSAPRGGAVLVAGGELVAFVGCRFTGNVATGSATADGGGAVFSTGLVLVVGSTFTGNTALNGTANGGAIMVAAGGTLDLASTTSTFTSNRAARAGGAIEAAGTLNVAGGTFTTNATGINGGAVHMTGLMTATFTGATVFDRNTAGMEGGGIWNSATGTLNMTGSQLTGNTAAGPAADQGGGGVFSDGGITTLTNLTITGNAATGAAGSGGGVQNTAGGRLTIVGGTVSNNTSVRAGGGVEANQSGGATGNTNQLTTVTVSGNNAGTAPGFGGGVHVTGAAVVTVTGGTVSGNTAIEGGGLWKSAAGTLTVNGTTIDNNTATGASADQGGGGVYNDGAGGVLTLANLTVSNNDATGASGSGGGLLNNVGGTTVVTDVLFSANTARRAGGGIEDNDGTLVSLLRTTLLGNTTGPAPGNGGGLHITGGGTVTADSSLVAQNTATNQGGGLWNSGLGQMTVRTTTVRGNTAGEGGGLYQVAGTKATLRVEQSLVQGNTAATTGGGIAADGAAVLVVNTTVTGNRAASGGGFAADGGRYLISNATVSSNTATTAGGGLFNTSATDGAFVSADNTIVADNTAPAGADLAGAIRSRGYNLFETTAGATVTSDTPATDITGVDPGLQPLADNGGPTLTQAIAMGSRAAGAGMTSLLFDQRGFTRRTPSSIGAFEFGGQPVAGEDGPAAGDAPAAFALSAAAPNPFRGQTTLRVTLATSEPVEVALYDALGRRVQTLYSGTPASTVDVTVDGRRLAPGVYVVRMTGASASATQRVTVAR